MGEMDADVDPDRIRTGLEQAGLTSYQADAYITLLRRGVSPAVDVAKNCSVPVPRIYDVLKDLEQRGYIETFEQDTLHARARDPVDVIDDLHSRSELLSDTAGAIENAWEQASLAEHKMSVVKHADTVLEEAEELVRDADTMIEVGVTREQLDALGPALEAATDDGIITRVSVFAESVHPDPDEFDCDVSELRARRIPGPFLAIVDRTHTCFAPNDRSERPYGVILNDSILSFIFHWYFQTCLWSIWPSVHKRPAAHTRYVSIEEFIRDVYPFWWHGARILVTVAGIHNDTGEMCEVSGVVTDLTYTDMDLRSPDPPSYGQLAGQSAVRLETGDGRLSIGSWGAVFEDVEAQRVELERIVLDRNGAAAAARTLVDNDLATTAQELGDSVITS